MRKKIREGRFLRKSFPNEMFPPDEAVQRSMHVSFRKCIENLTKVLGLGLTNLSNVLQGQLKTSMCHYFIRSEEPLAGFGIEMTIVFFYPGRKKFSLESYTVQNILSQMTMHASG